MSVDKSWVFLDFDENVTEIVLSLSWEFGDVDSAKLEFKANIVV